MKKEIKGNYELTDAQESGKILKDTRLWIYLYYLYLGSFLWVIDLFVIISFLDLARYFQVSSSQEKVIIEVKDNIPEENLKKINPVIFILKVNSPMSTLHILKWQYSHWWNRTIKKKKSFLVTKLGWM